MSVILETKQLCKFYGAGENQVKAVNQVDIQIEQGEFVAIVGKSGSGKSTLLHMLGGLDTPTKGSVTLAGKDLYRMKEDALAVFRRRKIGFVFHAVLLHYSGSKVVSCVDTDHDYGGYLMTRHLLDCGCRRIAFWAVCRIRAPTSSGWRATPERCV